MKPMQPREAEKWRGTRAKGKGRYVLVLGTLWGGWMIVLMAAVDYFRGVGIDLSTWSITSRLVIWGIAGQIWAHWVWSTQERRYEDLVRMHRSSDQPPADPQP